MQLILILAVLQYLRNFPGKPESIFVTEEKSTIYDVYGLCIYCTEDRECYNYDRYYSDRSYKLLGNGTQSCLNIKYKCSGTYSELCSIDCIGYESCKNIELYSMSKETIINYIDW
eukprot:517000_1